MGVDEDIATDPFLFPWAPDPKHDSPLRIFFIPFSFLFTHNKILSSRVLQARHRPLPPSCTTSNSQPKSQTRHSPCIPRGYYSPRKTSSEWDVRRGTTWIGAWMGRYDDRVGTALHPRAQSHSLKGLVVTAFLVNSNCAVTKSNWYS